MKLVVCVLALAAVAFAQTPISFNEAATAMGNIGYPNRAYGLTKSGASFAGTFHVPATSRPTPPSGGAVCMKIIMKPDNINSRTATMTATMRPYNGAASQAPVPVATDFGIFQMTGVTSNPPTSYSFTATLASNTTTYDGIAVGGQLTACSGCLRTADFILTALLGTTAAASCPSAGTGVNWVPFPIIDDKATWEFAVGTPATGYQTGPSGGVFENTAARDIYLLTIPEDSSRSISLAMSNTAAVPPAPSSVLDNSGTSGVYVLPLGTLTKNGQVRSGAIRNVAAGRWWVSPFVNSGSTWSFAVGFGHEPAAAGMLVPSMLLAAILAVVAMLL